MKTNLESVMKDFNWCEIKGKAEEYCMPHICAICPANKYGLNYNPKSKLVRMYKQGKIKSHFEVINEKVDEIGKVLGAS